MQQTKLARAAARRIAKLQEFHAQTQPLMVSPGLPAVRYLSGREEPTYEVSGLSFWDVPQGKQQWVAHVLSDLRARLGLALPKDLLVEGNSPNPSVAAGELLEAFPRIFPKTNNELNARCRRKAPASTKQDGRAFVCKRTAWRSATWPPATSAPFAKASPPP